MVRLGPTSGDIVCYVDRTATVLKEEVENLNSSRVVERCHAAIICRICEDGIDLGGGTRHNVGCTVRIGTARGIFAESSRAGQIVTRASGVSCRRCRCAQSRSRSAGF